MKITTLEEVFLYNLADVYNAEKQMAKTLPKLARAAKNEKLTEAFELHMHVTELQQDRVAKIIRSGDLKLPRTKCKALEALVEENNLIMGAIRLSSVRDVMLIANAQKMNHYEIASYACLVEMANKLTMDKAAIMLGDSQLEEMALSKKLGKIVIYNTDGEALRVAA